LKYIAIFIPSAKRPTNHHGFDLARTLQREMSKNRSFFPANHIALAFPLPWVTMIFPPMELGTYESSGKMEFFFVG
jgi:hypothetical protein